LKNFPKTFEKEYKSKVLNRLMMLKNKENSHLITKIVDDDITAERLATAQAKVRI
jgi:hypothetical protein